MFSSKNKNKVYILIFVIVIIVSIVYKVLMNGVLPDIGHKAPVIETSEVTTEPAETMSETIFVYICGEVNEPGVYEIKRGSILNEAVILAGGFTDDAAKEDVDLVRTLDENVTIKIPAIGEVVETIGETEQEDDGLIDINSASIEELKTLPGIGDSMARAIVNYRNENVFEKKEDIMEVSGIGEAKYNKIKDLICVK